MNDFLKQIWLGTRISLGTASFARLIAALPSPSDIYSADEEKLKSVLGQHRRDIRALLDKDTGDAEHLLEFCASREIAVITYWDSRYPDSLRRIPDPPVWLFVRGTLPDLKATPLIAVVGTRKPSGYGIRMTYELAYDLSAAGAVTVSGMALGVDGIAAAATLTAKGKTLAVLGCGLDIVYPPEHALLMREIIKNGAVLSEYPPGTSPDKWNFPKRNRIISGLADAVLVTEGSLYSGSLITAEYAGKQEKPVYALPGQVDEPGGEGPMKLLRDGARPVSCAEDLLSDLEERYPGKLNVFALLSERKGTVQSSSARYHIRTGNDRKKPERSKAVPDKGEPQQPELSSIQHDHDLLSGMEREVYDLIPESGDCTADQLTGNGIAIPDIGSSLTILELKQYILISPGGRISRKQ